MTSRPRRASGRRWARRTVPLAVVIAATGVFTAVPAGGSPGGTAPGSGAPDDLNSSIATSQAQVTRIEAQVAQEQQQVTALSEQYDQATVQLQQVQAQLAATEAHLSDVRQRHAVARHQLQVDAVNAYIYDTPANSLASLFSPASEQRQLRDKYQQTAIGDVNQAVNAYQAAERQLTAAESALQSQEQQASAQAVLVGQERQAAQAASDAAQATLTHVQGQLGQLVAEQAAQEAAAAAARAAAAASEQAKQQAAEQAAQAAQVAQNLAGGSAAAIQATNAANQAATSAGAVGTIGTGLPQTPTGAGAVALQEAEKYLGVPYQWGGADSSGVDCSGLTMLAWRAAGVGLVHSAEVLYDQSTHVALIDVRPGDLLFYALDGAGIDHVVMYVGSGPYGTATIIQAAHTGTVVEFDAVWYLGLVGAGRP